MMWKWFNREKFKKGNKVELPREHENYSNKGIRTPIEVGERILGLLAVIGKIHQGHSSEFQNWYSKNSIKIYLSYHESIFFEKDFHEQSEIINFSWKSEALTSLLWAINLIEEMPPLNKEFSVFSLMPIYDIINNPFEFKRSIKLRSDSVLKEMEAYLHEQHWKVRDTQLRGKKMPSELNPSVVYERRYGLSWLIGYGDDWDDVPTDT